MAKNSAKACDWCQRAASPLSCGRRRLLCISHVCVSVRERGLCIFQVSAKRAKCTSALRHRSVACNSLLTCSGLGAESRFDSVSEKECLFVATFLILRGILLGALSREARILSPYYPTFELSALVVGSSNSACVGPEYFVLFNEVRPRGPASSSSRPKWVVHPAELGLIGGLRTLALPIVSGKRGCRLFLFYRHSANCFKRGFYKSLSGTLYLDRFSESIDYLRGLNTQSVRCPTYRSNRCRHAGSVRIVKGKANQGGT